jgi:hypothetical protein
MRMGSRIYVLTLLCLAFLTVSLQPAQAYVDPGSGSFIFQALVGGILAAGLVLKMFWRRIVSVFTRHKGQPDEQG